jgi:hypothetical protein
MSAAAAKRSIEQPAKSASALSTMRTVACSRNRLHPRPACTTLGGAPAWALSREKVMHESGHQWVFVPPFARPPGTDRKQVASVLNQHQILGALGETHVLLRPSVPFVANRGWFDLYGSWSYHPQPPHDYAASNAPDLAQLTRVGIMEIWFAGLISGSRYIAAIDVLGSPHYPGPAHYNVQYQGKLAEIDVRGSKTLVIELTATSDRTVVTIDATNVAGYLFYQAELFRMDA